MRAQWAEAVGSSPCQPRALRAPSSRPPGRRAVRSACAWVTSRPVGGVLVPQPERTDNIACARCGSARTGGLAKRGPRTWGHTRRTPGRGQRRASAAGGSTGLLLARRGWLWRMAEVSLRGTQPHRVGVAGGCAAVGQADATAPHLPIRDPRRGVTGRGDRGQHKAAGLPTTATSPQRLLTRFSLPGCIF